MIHCSYLLVLAIMSSDSAVGSLSLHSLAIGSHQHGGHETQGAIPLGNNVGLDVTVIVLAGPDKTTLALQSLSNHVVNQTVFIPDASGVKLLLILRLKDILEDILETTV